MRIENPNKDPMGQALKAYQEGDHLAAIQVYSDVAIDDVIPVNYLYRGFEQMPAWERQALYQCKGRVLDIGAGAGSHALWLQEKGFEVVALDISPGAATVMRERGVSQVVHQDLFSYQAERFDTLLLMMNGIGIVGELKGLNQFLQYAPTLLNPNGQILLDSSDISYLYEDPDSDQWQIPEGRYQGIIEFQMSWQQCVGDKFFWLYIDYQKLKQHASFFGYQCEKIAVGPHHEYLARLTLPNTFAK